jgi:hypothetical protein
VNAGGLTQSNWQLMDTLRRGINAMVRHVIRTTIADVEHTLPLPPAGPVQDRAGPAVRVRPARATDAIDSAYGTWRRPENVIYSYDPTFQPEYQYFSIPSACIGGASNLDEARAAYRSDLAELLNLGQRDLPHAVEHLEIAVADVWLRSDIPSNAPSRSQTRRLVETCLAQHDTAERLGFELCPARNIDGMPVVVVVEPRDTLASVFNQMTAFDTLWIVYTADERHLNWLVLCGPEADGIHATSTTAEAAAVSAMPVATFVAQYTSEHNRCIRLR